MKWLSLVLCYPLGVLASPFPSLNPTKTLLAFRKQGEDGLNFAILNLTPKLCAEETRCAKGVLAVMIVLLKQALKDDHSLPAFEVVYGEISLGSDLEQISKTGSREGKTAVKHFLKCYRATHE